MLHAQVLNPGPPPHPASVTASFARSALSLCPRRPPLRPPQGFSTFSATVLALTFVFGNSVK